MTQGESRLHTSVSVGVALLDPAAGELMHSLAAAETACKAAKDRGRNRVEVYKANDLSLVRRFADINIAGQLRSAIDAGRLQLYAQLILPFACAEQPRPHFEILLRMLDEEGHTLGPDRFLSAANRYQLMPEIDRWVISQAIEMLKPHAELLRGHKVSFAINFSGQSLNDEEFVDFLLQKIRASGLDPGVFCFELTENATIANIARAESLIRALRKLGCGVALDDFGTGLSSLAYLRQLPVTMLKIDGSFVRDILKDPRAESMVHAIAQLARSMSLVDRGGIRRDRGNPHAPRHPRGRLRTGICHGQARAAHRSARRSAAVGQRRSDTGRAQRRGARAANRNGAVTAGSAPRGGVRARKLCAARQLRQLQRAGYPTAATRD